MQMKSRNVCTYTRFHIIFMRAHTVTNFNHDTHTSVRIYDTGWILRFALAIQVLAVGVEVFFQVSVLCVAGINYLHTDRFMVEVLKLNVTIESSQIFPSFVPLFLSFAQSLIF